METRIAILILVNDLLANRPLSNLRRTEKSAAHSDSLGNSRKLGESPPVGPFASPCKLKLFRYIFTFPESYDNRLFW